jgi:hypothetical protein
MAFGKNRFVIALLLCCLAPTGCSVKVSRNDPMEEVILRSMGKYEFTANEKYQDVYEIILNQARSCFHDAGTKHRVVQGDLQPEKKAGRVIVSIADRSGYQPYFGFNITSIGENATKVESYWVDVNDNHMPRIAERWVKEKYTGCL